MEQSWTNIVSAVGQILSVIISLVGFWFVWAQIKQTNKNLTQSNHTSIYSINTEIYKFFAEHSELRPYFHEGKPLTKDDENRNKIFSISELLADFFEFILVEEDSLSPAIRQPWINYIRKVYIKSSAFREFIHINKDQYSDKILSIFTKINITQTDLIINVKNLISEKELLEIDTIYQNCFNEHSVPTETQKKWWNKNKEGIIGLYSDNKIIGGISFWAINIKTFEKLRSGQLQERAITTDDFETHRKNFYYISDIAIKDEYKSKLYSYLLLRNLVEVVEKNVYLSSSINILAFSFSENGNKLLVRLGFNKIKDAEDTLDKQDLYLLTLKSKSDIEQLKKRLL